MSGTSPMTGTKPMTGSKHRVCVSRTIDAPAGQLFGLLVHAANHPAIDGSGMVRESADQLVVGAVGDVFVMKMHHDEFGDYQMANHVVEFEPGQRITWEPVRHEGSQIENLDDAENRGYYLWGYELAPAGAGSTVVTETFDCSRSPEELRAAVKDGHGWIDAMTASLENLDKLSRA